MKITTEAFVLLIVIIFNLSLGIFVYMQRPRRLVHRVFFIADVGTFVWGLGLILLTETHLFAFNMMIIYGFIIFLFGFVLFAHVFPATDVLPRRLYALFLPLALIACLVPFNLIIRDAVYHSGNHPEAVNGPLFPIFGITLVFYFVIGLWSFFKTYRRSQGLPRLQMQYLALGLSVFLVATFLFDILLPAFGVFELNFLGPIASVALTGLTAYAIIRHRLLDIRVVIQRSLVYTILLAILISLYAVAIGILSALLHKITDSTIIVSAGATMVLGIVFMEPLKDYFRKVTDHIFFKNGYVYADALYRLSRIIYTTIRRQDIVDASSELLKDIFKTNEVSFILEPEAVAHLGEWHQVSGFATLAAPIMFEDRSVGVLRLGKKRSGDMYTERDRQLISTFAVQAAIAFGKAALYEKVEEYNLHLEQLVEKRTGEIQKMQEDQRQAMVDISHNLQTPLAVIKGELELLGEHSSGDKMRAVERSIDRVSSFIRQLLHLSRLGQSAYAPELLPLDLAALLADQVEYFEVMAAEKNVRVVSDIPGPAMIRGDKQLLEELFTNLVVNSISYRRTDIGSFVKIALSEEYGSYHVSVEDNGLGIDPKDLPNLFTRFYRVPRTPNAPQGTGLGLAIVKKIVDAHGASVSVQSVVGKGTTITVRFPEEAMQKS